MDRLKFDPAATAFDPIDLADAAGISQCAEQSGLPYLHLFLEDVSRKQSQDDESLGRRYQREVIERRALQIVSPLSGLPVKTSRSIAVHGCVFYHFDEPVDYFVASSQVRLGYPLTAIFLPQANRLLDWTKSRRLLQYLAMLATLIDEAEESDSQIGDVIPVVVIGHQNFAHHLWNELSALERFLTEMPAAAPPELLVARETLGPLDTIFPEVAGWKITRTGDPRKRLGNEPDKLYVNLAGFRVSASLRARIVQHARNMATAETKSLIQRISDLNGPVFWLSVRTQSPTLTNQKDALVAIAGRLAEKYPECCILFDGFSLPEDWRATPDDEMKTFYDTAIRDARHEIDCIVEELSRTRPFNASQMVVNAGGLGILDTIALAQLADVYFCHKGSIQHKIGWTTNKPGIIHGPRRALRKKAGKWHAEQSDGAAMPIEIKRAMIENTGEGPETDYRVVDCEALGKFVHRYFKLCLSQDRIGRPPTREVNASPT